jgi:hypothetical protein
MSFHTSRCTSRSIWTYLVSRDILRRKYQPFFFLFSCKKLNQPDTRPTLRGKDGCTHSRGVPHHDRLSRCIAPFGLPWCQSPLATDASASIPACPHLSTRAQCSAHWMRAGTTKSSSPSGRKYYIWIKITSQTSCWICYATAPSDQSKFIKVPFLCPPSTSVLQCIIALRARLTGKVTCPAGSHYPLYPSRAREIWLSATGREGNIFNIDLVLYGYNVTRLDKSYIFLKKS